MTRSVLVARHLVLILLLLFLMTACGGSVESTVSKTTTVHTHAWGEWKVTQEATCTSTGERTRTCVCGESEREVLAMAEHTPEKISAVKATCTTEGLTEGVRCAVCEEILTKQTVTPVKKHTPLTDVGVPATCTKTGLTNGSHCMICHEILTVQTIIPIIAHTAATQPAVAPTCTAEGKTEGSYCVVCLQVLKEPATIPPLPHTPTATPAVAATCAAEGHESGMHCSVCNTVLTVGTVIEKLPHTIEGNKCLYCDYLVVNYADPTLYASSYGYDYLGTLEKGPDLQELYRRLDAVALEFHTNTNKAVTGWVNDDLAYLDAVYYKDLDLTYDDVKLVMRFFCYCDRPIYYWISNGFTHSSSGKWIKIRVDAPYADGKDRAYYNKLLYDSIEEFAAITKGITSAYEIALFYHDAIISTIDYAYEEDGVTPQNDRWAHNITGVFLKQGVTCEGYAQAFQLLLTLSNIENVYVLGESKNAAHAWNLVRLDDGNWYWYDVTWDDLSSQKNDGVKYQHFAVNDTQFINWLDAHTGWNSPQYGNKTFLDSHIVGGVYVWLYDLPARSETVFGSNEILEIGEPFSVDGMTFARWGADTVTLVSAPARNTVTIPETIEYEGRTYTVVMLAQIDANGYFYTESVIADDAVTEIILPDTIRRIGYRTFRDCSNLKRIALPESVTEIGTQAFSRCGNLEQVIISEGVTKIGFEAFVFCRKLKSVTIPDSVTTLEKNVFRECSGLTEIVLPRGLTEIPEQLFLNCSSLRDIHFKGTVAEWEALVKGAEWNSGVTNCTVHCTDGDLALS